jgi:branched-chain amino acid transport system permease protein
MAASEQTIGRPDTRANGINLALWAILILFVLTAPAYIYTVFAMQLLCFALFACAFNLLLGFTGLLSFGHAAFFGAGAYLAGHAIKIWGLPPLAGILFGTAPAAELGYVNGWLANRRQGI